MRQRKPNKAEKKQTKKKESKISRVVKQAETKASKPSNKEKEFNPSDFVSSGSTLLNLALTDHPDCGWQKGKMANVIGDSGAGKTLLVLTSLAEAANDPKHDDTDLIYDDAENALEFDLDKVFGKKTERRVQILDPPSNTIEEFSDNVALARDREIPFIYVLDSFDAIGSDDDTKHIESERKIRMGESKKESKGSFGTAKPKLASQLLREECGKLKKTKGALLIISQTRDNLTPGSFEKKTRSGGKALKFYATHEVWVILVGAITSTNKRKIGAEALIKVTKNKVTGKKRNVKFSIFDGYGIDDIGSMIDFLIEEKVWSGGGKKGVDTNGDIYDEPMQRTKLIDYIEENEMEKKLKKLVTRVWLEIEEDLKPKRKHKYE